MTSLSQLFLVFLKLGLTSFGGPVAHISYFRKEFVERRQWLSSDSFADLLALCQFLPGPSSSQLGLSIGLMRGGILGGFLAWLGFTLPSALIMTGFGLSLGDWSGVRVAGWTHGLKLVAVAVVADALWTMGKALAPDKMRLSLLLAAAALASIVPGAVGQVTVIVLAAIAGQFLSVIAASAQDGDPAIRLPFWLSIAVLAVFFAGLFGLPFWAMIAKDGPISLFAIFYHAGALVFGGGHVVLPLLRDGLVPSGWIGNDQFLAGYALAQAVPGPLFTFAAFLGAAGAGTPRGWVGALIALIAIFLPSFLLLVGLLPFWHRLKRNHRVRAALMGINAGVVGLLLAAFYNPILSSSLLTPLDFALALLMFAALSLWRIPAWLLVLAAGAASIISAVS